MSIAKNFEKINLSLVGLLTKNSDASLILGQLHYWLHTESGKIVDNARWIWNTYEQWQQQFSYLSKYKIRKALLALRDLGVVEFQQLDAIAWKQRGYYTINYEVLQELLGEVNYPEKSLKALKSPMCRKSKDRSCENENINDAKFETSYIEQNTSCKILQPTNAVVESVKSEQPFLPPEAEGKQPEVKTIPQDLDPRSKDLALEQRRKEALLYLERVEANSSLKKSVAEEKMGGGVTQKKQELLHSFKAMGVKATEYFLGLFANINNTEEILEDALLATKAQARGRGFDRGIQAFAQAAIQKHYKLDRPQPGEAEMIHPQSANFSKEFLDWYEENKSNEDIIPFALRELTLGYDREPQIAIKVMHPLTKAPHTWISWREYQKK